MKDLMVINKVEAFLENEEPLCLLIEKSPWPSNAITFIFPDYECYANFRRASRK
jgi:hypothetical protein